MMNAVAPPPLLFIFVTQTHLAFPHERHLNTHTHKNATLFFYFWVVVGACLPTR